MVVYGRRKHLSGVWGKVSQKQSEGLFAQNRRYLSVCCYQSLFHVFLFTNCKKKCCYIYLGITFQANDKGNTTQFRENTPLGIIFFLCLWKLHLIFFRNLQQNSQIWVYYMNTGLCKIMFSNMTLKYNKLWFFFIFETVCEGQFETRHICISTKTFIFILFQIFPAKFLSKWLIIQKEAYS